MNPSIHNISEVKFLEQQFSRKYPASNAKETNSSNDTKNQKNKNLMMYPLPQFGG
jgi:hypothetical protein